MKVVITLDRYELSLCAWRREGDLSCFALRVFRGPTDFGRAWVRVGFELRLGEWAWRRQWSTVPTIPSSPPEGILVDAGTPEDWRVPEIAGWMRGSLAERFGAEAIRLREVVEGLRRSEVGLPGSITDRGGVRSVQQLLRELHATGIGEYRAYRTTEEERVQAERLTGMAQAAAEPPLSFCSDCPGRFRPEDLFIGKKTGIPLCERCLDRRVLRGAAKRPDKF